VFPRRDLHGETRERDPGRHTLGYESDGEGTPDPGAREPTHPAPGILRITMVRGPALVGMSGWEAMLREGTGPHSETVEEPTVDRELVYDALSNTRRRHVIHCVLQEEEPVELADLSRRIAAWENDVAIEAVTSTQRKRVYTALRQLHLPKLDETGIVSFDPDRGTVESTRTTPNVEAYLRVVPEDEITWSRFYVGLGAILGAATLLAWLGLFPFSELPGHAWGLLSGLAVMATGLAHVVSDRRHQIGSDGAPPGY